MSEQRVHRVKTFKEKLFKLLVDEFGFDEALSKHAAISSIFEN